MFFWNLRNSSTLMRHLHGQYQLEKMGPADNQVVTHLRRGRWLVEMQLADSNDNQRQS